jgi:uncharacterized protein with HEPN domain
MKTDDEVRLRHMLEAAREAISFAEGRSRTDLDDNRMLFHARVRNMEIIGEAGSQVSKEFRDTRSGLPWADVIGMRNRLIHAYFDIDPDIVWDTATQDLPLPVAALTELMADPVSGLADQDPRS